MANYMVYDIGGSAVKWSIITNEGKILISDKLEIAKTVKEFFCELTENVNIFREEFTIEGIAISAPGAVDSESGEIKSKSAIPYIYGVNFKEILSEKTGLNVEIENDANCAALGECWLGAAKENADSAFIVCGTGIGGAIVKEKRIHTGSNMHGGEFGFCIVDCDINTNRLLSWSDVGSTFALVKAIANRKGIDINEFNGKKAFDLYDLGDEVAIEEVNKFFTYMAVGIINIQYTYDPEAIILGGAISEREGIIDEINKKVLDILSRNDFAKVIPKIRKCEYGNDANKLGALYNYMQKQKLIIK
ncbi:ROK family protein [uncultured Clostridium sp.]|uniref:ROK family protein n=1 Tax=uncultured Clostridium sp. TaxID=59620 RepID=UPI0025D3B10F|nr:ROK family protein [uncultured Clostridium sp.]MDU2491215.1 ROK family protein [Clostridium celatum]MDU4884166.1 ROK family protein [Clostridium celatum]MDU7077375.1 ROK family protein [Clostridium celatum]